MASRARWDYINASPTPPKGGASQRAQSNFPNLPNDQTTNLLNDQNVNLNDNLNRNRNLNRNDNLNANLNPRLST